VYHLNYYYSSRWRPMDTHGPITPGERIGFLVTSGNARDSVGPYGPMERSNVVVIAATNVGTFTFAETPAPTIVPQPPPAIVQPPPIVSQPPPVVAPANDVLLTQIKALVEQELVLQQDTNAKTTRIDGEVRTFSEQFGTVMKWVGMYVAPAVAAWFTGKAVAKP
jgi:hypothetical protein